MARFRNRCRAAMALAAVLLASATAQTQEGGRPSALSRLEPGRWELKNLDSGSRYASICVADPAMLMQLQHRNSPCSRLVISSSAQETTVHYTCPATGFGRTTLRVETPRLAQIDTQGISRNVPFAYRIEARRSGSCEAGSATAGR
jgi:hypothetical protein